MLSSSQFPSLPEIPYHVPQSPTPTSVPLIPLHWNIYQAFIGPRTSPPIDAWQGHPLQHMQLEPCVLLCWWLSPWEHLGDWLVDIIVLPLGLQTPSAPSVLSPPLGTTFSVQWLAVNVCLCTMQTLAEPLRRQPYQAPVSKHFLASTIASRFGVCVWDGSPSAAVSGWPFLQTLLPTLSPYFFLWVFCFPF